jgi:hypothetical protein
MTPRKVSSEEKEASLIKSLLHRVARFFAEGAVNKLYEVLRNLQEMTDKPPTVYLFRVKLPVCPFYKTESEVATLKYIRINTEIPVATIVAWDSTAKDDLDFEWIIYWRECLESSSVMYGEKCRGMQKWSWQEH